VRQRFVQGLSFISNLCINTDLIASVPHILNVQFTGMLADALLAELPLIAASTASACQGKGTEGSYVLRAMQLSEEQIKSSLRFSFGRFTSLVQTDQAIELISNLFRRD
jgi:cysteine desulfurase